MEDISNRYPAFCVHALWVGGELVQNGQKPAFAMQK
jgi:hypothetical protein